MEALGACVIATLTCLLSIESLSMKEADEGIRDVNAEGMASFSQFFQKEALERATPFSHVVS